MFAGAVVDESGATSAASFRLGGFTTEIRFDFANCGDAFALEITVSGFGKQRLSPGYHIAGLQPHEQKGPKACHVIARAEGPGKRSTRILPAL